MITFSEVTLERPSDGSLDHFRERLDLRILHHERQLISIFVKRVVDIHPPIDLAKHLPTG